MTNEQIEAVLQWALEAGRREIPNGKCADYIPELARADRNKLGICVCTVDGKRYYAGDTADRFTIQSISKVINLCAALEICGFEKVFEKVGMEPSGDPFNSLIKLDLDSSHPYNPMINSGAIAVCSYLVSKISFEEMTEYARRLCMDPGIRLDQKVYLSEKENCSRNRAIGYLLQSKGVIETDVEESLDYYTRMCSLSVTAESLAGLGLVLANGGIHPETGKRLLDEDVVRVVKTIMFTCGMYDGSGQFAVRVGIPSKSGVGGGILSVADRRMGIGIYGPALDKKGNSVAGKSVLCCLSRELGLHVFP